MEPTTTPIVAHEGLEVRTATADMIREIATTKVDSFLDKATRFCTSRSSAIEREVFYLEQSQPWALEQCGVVVESSTSAVVGICQLKFHGQPGDPSLSCVAHRCGRQEAYVEYICVADGNRGKGIGRTLLDWADAEAIRRSCVKITLEVTTSNPAKGLYERHGYRVVSQSDVFDLIFIWCLIGASGTYYMEKNLQ